MTDLLNAAGRMASLVVVGVALFLLTRTSDPWFAGIYGTLVLAGLRGAVNGRIPSVPIDGGDCVAPRNT